MSFDATVYFAAIPDDLAAKWQDALRELGTDVTVLIPPDWEEKRHWYLLAKPADNPDDSFAIVVGRVDQAQLLGKRKYADDEIRMLSVAHYYAFVSTRLSAGSAALVVAGSLAKVTAGVVRECQDAAFEEAFEADLAAHRGPRGPEGKPTLAERGYYDSRLAWEVAKAAHAYEDRQKAGQHEEQPSLPTGAGAVPFAPEATPKKAISPMAIVVGLGVCLLGAVQAA